MNQPFFDLYDDYKKGAMDRREFFKRLAHLAGGFGHGRRPGDEISSSSR